MRVRVGRIVLADAHEGGDVAVACGQERQRVLRPRGEIGERTARQALERDEKGDEPDDRRAERGLEEAEPALQTDEGEQTALREAGTRRGSASQRERAAAVR